MPTSARDATTDDALYPDQLPGRRLELDPDRLDGELEVWDARDDDDAEALPDGADYGNWLPVVDHSGPEAREVWASAPRGLLEELLEAGAEPGDYVEVGAHHRGDAEHDPHTFEDVILTGPDGGPVRD